MSIKEKFYKHMYEMKTIERHCDSGNHYIIDYHRSQFWAYEKPSLWLFFKEKFTLWHGQVWLVYENGSRCGFGTCCFRALFPEQRMEEFLISEVNCLEKIFNKENDYET